ncbi:MAG: hypothetical protein J1F01_01425 [Oscillospiraceae bacterium]|nr:hypothetical protein [Oscillospiraceae bacterium]
MKKIFVGLSLTLLLLLVPVLASAEVGDVVGTIYTTDILATVNGEQIQSYNIGGRTAIIAEDLDEQYYGFRCDYNDEIRTLNVRGLSIVKPYDRGISRGKVGGVAGNVYETDIKVIFNGHEVQGYNIGGKTAIVIEDLGTPDGSSPNEEYGFTKYMCSFVWDNDTRTVSLTALLENQSEFMSGFYGVYPDYVPCIKYALNDNILTVNYSPDNDYFSGMDWENSKMSDEFCSEEYRVWPLYFDRDGEQVQIGYCWNVNHSDGFGIESVCINREVAYPLIEALMPTSAPMSYEEIMNKFQNDDRYTIRAICDTENFTFLAVEDSEKKIDDVINAMRLISVYKVGGYVTLATESADYDTVEAEKIDVDTVSLTVAPFGGPHGSTSMRQEFKLAEYVYAPHKD